MDEFAVEINFKFGVPMIILDMINAFTGFDIISHIKRELIPNNYIERLNPDSEIFLNYKNQIVDDFQDLAFGVFNNFGELDLTQIQDDINQKLALENQKSIDEQSKDNKESSNNIGPKEMPIRDKERI